MDCVRQVDVIDTDTIKVLFEGPESSPFSGSVLSLFFSLPSDYPYNQPILTFENSVFHPNISQSGAVCSSSETWTMFMTMERELNRVCNMLVNPIVSDPLNLMACNMYTTDKELYTATAKGLLI